MNTLIEQLTKVWQSLGINQKVSIILSVGGVLIGMTAIIMWSSRPRMQLLYGRLDAQEMSEVVRIVEERGVEYELKASGSSIFVTSDEVHGLRMSLASEGIPNGGSVGFEIFDQGNFGISDFVQRTNYIRAVQGELGRTISQLRGVRSARVMVVIPENRMIVSEGGGSGSSASVFVDTGGLTLDEDAVSSIRFLVANAVEGLEARNVAIVDSNGNALSQDLAEDQTVGMASGQFKFRKNLEDYFGRKIESMLTPIVGLGNVIARVSVELDTSTQTMSEELFDPEGQVVRTQTLTEDKSESMSETANNPAGLSGNIPDAEGGLANGRPVQQTQDESVTRTTNYELNKTVRETVKMPGGIKGIQAAVLLASQLDGEGADAQPVPRGQEELDKIRRMIINALGIITPEGANLEEYVTVAEKPFVEPVPGFNTPAEPRLMNTLNVTDIIRNALGIGIAVVMFVMFLRMLKRYKPDSVDVEVMEESAAANGGEGGGQKQLEMADLGGQITPEFLNELIQERPENISTALKNWVQNQQRN
ncbi:MAG: flagellar basal-body MS-ring/collar protein FliF [Opitutales bacterium]